MFEYDQDIVEVLLNDDDRFQALYKDTTYSRQRSAMSSSAYCRSTISASAR